MTKADIFVIDELGHVVAKCTTLTEAEKTAAEFSTNQRIRGRFDVISETEFNSRYEKYRTQQSAFVAKHINQPNEESWGFTRGNG